MQFVSFSKFELHYWPALTSSWFIITFIICYFVSLQSGHVQEFLPFISDTGEKPPESCIFGQMVNIGAIFITITMYIRYRQVDLAIRSVEVDLNRRWNEAAFWFGNIVCLGVSFVGNFQKSSFPTMHFVGAFMAFGLAIIYFFIQTRISFAFNSLYRKHPENGISSSISLFRLCLWLLYILFFTVTLVCGIISVRISKDLGDKFPGWSKQEEGYNVHVAATISEWLMFFTFMMYTMTGTKEFKTLKFKEIIFQNKTTLKC